MKHVTWIFLILLLCSLTSFVEKNVATQGLNVGDIAPNFSIKNISGEKIKELNELKGSYVLLSFWASYDAPSRMQNALLNHTLKENDYSIKIVSVSFDEYLSIFNETIKKDKIENSDCFVEVSGETSNIYKKYQLNKGFKNFLLNKEGIIIAKNIKADQFLQYINN